MTKAKPYWVSVKGKGDHGREARVLTQCLRKRPIPGQKIAVSVKLGHKSAPYRVTRATGASTTPGSSSARSAGAATER